MAKNIIHFALMGSFITSILSPLISNLYAQNTLNEEQTKEVEKDPISIIEGCSYRVGAKLDPGKLCDAFSTYLHDKCERLDYLPDYCGPVAMYYPKRSVQKECMSNIPLPDDALRIKTCFDYIVFNSTYSKLPLNLTLEDISFDIYNAAIDPTFSVYNPNPLAKKLVTISFEAKQGSNIASGMIGDTMSNTTTCPDCGYYIEPITTKDFTIPGGQVSSTWNIMQSNTP
jgi:hypothetical protein